MDVLDASILEIEEASAEEEKNLRQQPRRHPQGHAHLRVSQDKLLKIFSR